MEVVVTGDALADANFGRSLDANPVVAAVGLVSNYLKISGFSGLSLAVSLYVATHEHALFFVVRFAAFGFAALLTRRTSCLWHTD
jgi:hypothetical protein